MKDLYSAPGPRAPTAKGRSLEARFVHRTSPERIFSWLADIMFSSESFKSGSAATKKVYSNRIGVAFASLDGPLCGPRLPTRINLFKQGPGPRTCWNPHAEFPQSAHPLGAVKTIKKVLDHLMDVLGSFDTGGRWGSILVK